MKSGVIELSILALLRKREMYGYEISQMILDMSKQAIEVSEGTLYPILYRLEEKDVIESHWQAPEGRGKPRKYYRVTEEGQKYFKEYQREWIVVADFMQRVMGNF